MNKKLNRKIEAGVLITVMLLVTTTITFEARGNNPKWFHSVWEKTIGGDPQEQGYSLDTCTDGGYIVSGTTLSGGDSDIYYVKTDGKGNVEWSKTYGTSQYSDKAYCIQQTTDGGYIITGDKFRHQVPHYQYLYLIKTFANGTIDWVQNYSGGVGKYVKQTGDGGYIVVGYKGRDILAIRTDQFGNDIWSRTYDFEYIDRAEGVELSTNGYVITGWFWDGGANEQCILMKVEPTRGDVVWTRFFGKSFQGVDKGYSVKKTNDEGFIIGGECGSYGGHGLWLIKTDINGIEQWNYTYGGGSGRSVDVCADGGYILTGSTNIGSYSEVHLLKTDKNGNVEIMDFYGGSDMDYGYSVREAYPGCYVVAGTTWSPGQCDIYLLKIKIFPQYCIDYYFNDYDENEAWHYNPELMVDLDPGEPPTTYAYTDDEIGHNNIELCNSNNCNGGDLGTIITVNIRAWWYKNGAWSLDLKPVFDASIYGQRYRETLFWYDWIDITNDSAAPDTWTWNDVKNLDCEVSVISYIIPAGGPVYCGRVDIRVVYY